MSDNITIAVYQGKILQGNAIENLNKTIQQLEIAESKGVDILCMPESFLHGYFESKNEAVNHSICLDSDEYRQLLGRLSRFKKTTLLLGVNEQYKNEIYNTVVVIEGGQHIGSYRKAYTYSPYDYFSLGKEFPIFEKKGVRYGIVICIDCMYQEPAHILALKGAQIIFCPMFNKVKNDARMLNFLNSKSHFIARAFENESWFAASDIVWEDDGKYICPGSATIFNKNGEMVSVSIPFSESLLQYQIPLGMLRDDSWEQTHYRRMLGNPDLREILMIEYVKNTIINKGLL